MYKWSRIAKLGIELEGGWNSKPQDLKPDGSVNSINCAYLGEVASKPLGIKSVLSWVDKNYPDKVNHTCGLHIHISLYSHADYSKLMSRKFFLYLHREFKSWGLSYPINDDSAFWKRMAGENTYCKNKFNNPDKQAETNYRESIRYSHLNYCFKLHGTIEFRMLPMFQKKEIALSAIQKYYDIVNEWLAKQPIEKAIKEVLMVTDSPEVEIQTEEVL